MTNNQSIAIVTGANNGIGFETTTGMAKAGYRVVMACRNIDKAEQAKHQILQRFPEAQLDVIWLDLSDPNSVRNFAEEFRGRFSHLNVLINNAGILAMSKKTGVDGIELQFLTNHLGHFLLTSLLFDMLPDDPTSRIVHLSSLAHHNAQIHLDDLTCGGNGLAAYGQSKLACLMFGEELDRRLRAKQSSIRSISVHPGGSDSGLFDEMSRWQYYMFKVLSPFIMNTQESAAKPSLFAALDPNAAGGAYYGPQGFREYRGHVGIALRDLSSTEPELAKQLWSLSEKLTDQDFRLAE